MAARVTNDIAESGHEARLSPWYTRRRPVSALAALIALVAVVVGTTVIVANRDASAPRAVAAAQPSTGQAPVRLSGDTRQVRVKVRQEAALFAKTCVEAIPDEGVGI